MSNGQHFVNGLALYVRSNLKSMREGGMKDDKSVYNREYSPQKKSKLLRVDISFKLFKPTKSALDKKSVYVRLFHTLNMV